MLDEDSRRDGDRASPTSCAFDPQQFLTRQDMCFLKMAMGLLVVKRRMERRERTCATSSETYHLSTAMDDACHRLSETELVAQKPNHIRTGSSVYTYCNVPELHPIYNAATRATPTSTSKNENALKINSDSWEIQQDAMMEVSHQLCAFASPSSPTLLEEGRYEDCVSRIAEQLSLVAMDALSHINDDRMDILKDWTTSYLITMLKGAFTFKLWVDIVLASQLVDASSNSFSRTIVPDLMAVCVVRLLKLYMDSNADVSGPSTLTNCNFCTESLTIDDECCFFTIELLRHVFQFVSEETAHVCRSELWTFVATSDANKIASKPNSLLRFNLRHVLEGDTHLQITQSSSYT